MRRTAFTVTFDGQFWVGILERWDDESLLVGGHVFGPEPRHAELTRFLLDQPGALPLRRAAEPPAPKPLAGSVKRRLRELGYRPTPIACATPRT